MSAKNKIRQIKPLDKKVKAPFISKEAFVFLSFLVFSTLLWFLYKTSHIQELKIEIPVSYTGIPNNVDIAGKLPKSLTVKFKDKGSTLFTYILKEELPPFRLDLSGMFASGSGRIALPTSKYEGRLLAKLKPTATQIRISPDTLVVVYSHLYKKTVPVKFAGTIRPAQQFMLTRGISLYPSMIEVYGNRQYLDTLQCIYTEPIRLKDVKDSIDNDFYLKAPRGIRLSQAKVNVHVAVEAFTEKMLEIPVASINVPGKYYLRTFPATVKVTCLVGISHFKTLQSEDIQAVVNYNSLAVNNTGKAKVEIYSQSPYLLSHHVVPETVDFLLETKK